MWETMHKNYWLRMNCRHKVNFSSNENSQEQLNLLSIPSWNSLVNTIPEEKMLYLTRVYRRVITNSFQSRVSTAGVFLIPPFPQLHVQISAPPESLQS